MKKKYIAPKIAILGVDLLCQSVRLGSATAEGFNGNEYIDIVNDPIGGDVPTADAKHYNAWNVWDNDEESDGK